ncbi:hypothetical protein [Pelagibius sp. Alg239-R121]|uniref:hypothetical protein n=1 Tax=Pelagibius sp. Alg239-R121 TaxID=2993448 RepID=UPI0024A76E02|nr:hypothetical protein [Pelagibius sp. Alg239-R121]
MPGLKLVRQEVFADLIASDMQPAAAYEAAGYRAKEPAKQIRKLLAKPEILARIEELKCGLDDAGVEAENRPSILFESRFEKLRRTRKGRPVDKDWIVECLVENIERSLGLKPLRDRNGRTVGSYSHQGSVANKALELLGRQLGLFGEKRDGKGGGFGDLSDDELNELEADLGRQVAVLERIQRRVEAGEAEAPGEK